MIQYIPSSLDIDLIFQEKPKDAKLERDKMVHILNLVSELPAYNSDILTDDGFVPLNGQKLQQRGIKNYPEYLNYFVGANILETDGYYIPEEKSTGYRFTTDYQTTLKEEEITKWTLCRNIMQNTRPKQTHTRELPYLYKWFNEDLNIDFDGAMDYLNMQLQADTYNRIPNALMKHNASYLCLQKLLHHEFHFSIDPTVFRLHTNLTTLKSELRNFLTYRDENLISLDYSNSQPLIAAYLFNPAAYSLTKNGAANSVLLKICEISQENSERILSKSVSPNGRYSPSIMLVKSLQCIDAQDIDAFCRVVQDGDLYEHIEREIEQRTGAPLLGGRKAVKTAMFQAFFSDNRFIGQPDAAPKRIFREVFPSVYEHFAFIKSGQSNLLAKVLQTLESELVLRRIAKRIAKERPKLTIFTIHDSITTTVGNEDYVREIMTEEMQKAMNLTPSIKTELWTPDKIDWYKFPKRSGERFAA